MSSVRLNKQTTKQLQKRVRLRISKSRLHLSLEVTNITRSCRVKPFDPIRRELRDGNCSQDADDRNNNQQLDEGKAFSVPDFV